jgi:hypothetical protein
LVITVARSNISLMLAYALASMLFLAGAYLMVGEELRETITRLPHTLLTKSAETS